ncbi:hypothetical protein PHMEG_00031630, partial [Phytophthora megakarya]
MIESEVAETLMSLSAPDERKFADNPLYAAEPPSWQAGKKRGFAAFDGGVASSLPSSSFLQMSLLKGRPLTSMIPGREDTDSNSDVDMDSSDEASERTWSAYRSPFDGLVAAASNQDDSDSYSASNS